MIWFNVFLLVILMTFPVLLKINKHYFKGKIKPFNRFLKIGRKVHPYVGIFVILIGAFHGYSMMGTLLTLHTGSVLLFLLIMNAFIGFAYKKTKKRLLSKLHQSLGGIILISFLLHYVKPWFFS